MNQMLTKPLVVGVGWRPVDTKQPLKDMLKAVGSNTGNLIFSDAVFGLFENPIRTTFMRAAAGIYPDRDCIVIAAANWLNERADFGPLAEKLERTTLPIIVLGLGAQSGLDSSIPKLRPGTERFVHLLADRSPKISARGEFSCDVLAEYGVRNAIPTGCPSMLSSGVTPPSFRPLRPWETLQPEDIVIHGTRHHFHQAKGISRDLYRFAMTGGHDLLLQSELADFYAALGRTNVAEINEKAARTLTEVYDETPQRISAYLRKHGKVFFDVDSWLAYCRTKAFLIGTRIHGTISGILAGTPSLLIAHDSRTVELARLMNVPYILEQNVDLADKAQMRQLYEQLADHDFSESYQRYKDNFQTFFDACNMRTVLSEAETGKPAS